MIGPIKTTSGMLAVTTDSVSATSVFNGGLAFDSNGNLHVSDGGTIAFYVGGLPVTSTGALVIDTSGTASGVFSAGFALSTAGRVMASNDGTISGSSNGVPVNSSGVIVVSGGAPVPYASDIIGYLDAETLTGADGTAIATWVDSKNSMAYVQATGTKQPLLYNNVVGGKKFVRFDGVNDVLVSARVGSILDTTLASQLFTTIIVLKPNAAKPNGIVFTGASTAANNLYIADGNHIGRWGGVGTSTTTAYPTTSRGFNVLVQTCSPAASNPMARNRTRTYLNGSCFYEAGTLVSPPNADFCVGALGATGTNCPCSVDVALIIHMNRELDPTEVIKFTDYLYTQFSEIKPWTLNPYFVILDGNSFMNGEGVTSSIAGRTPYLVAQGLGLIPGQWTSHAASFMTAGILALPAVIAEWSGIGAYLGLPQKVAFIEFYNDPSHALTNTQAYCNAVRAIANTKLTLCTSTSTASDPSSIRQTFDDYFDANYAAYCDAYVPVHLNTLIGLNGEDAVGGNSYYNNSATYWAESIHYNAAGNGVFAPLIVTGIQATL